MSGKSKIINSYKKLKYFDQNLRPLKEKVQSLKKEDVKEAAKLLKELKLVNYYITMHYYCNLNENTPIMPPEFKHKIINNLDKEFVQIPSIGKQFPTMPEDKFNLYLDIYKELQNVT